MEIGIGELRDHLRRYVHEVRAGSEIVITDHGRAVARLIPFLGPGLLDRLIDEGVVTRASVDHRPLATPPVKVRGTVSDLVAEQRR